MKTHDQIDLRSLAMAKAIVAKIDLDPTKAGLTKARATCEEWFRKAPNAAVEEWRSLLRQPWKEVREVLLNPSEEGRRLRQSDPFCGILTPQERWSIYKAHCEAS